MVQSIIAAASALGLLALTVPAGAQLNIDCTSYISQEGAQAALE